MADRGLSEYPAWLRDVDAALPVTRSYILHSNIRDMYLVNGRHLDLIAALWDVLQRNGYAGIIHYTPHGIRVIPPDATETVLGAVGIPLTRLGQPMGYEELTQLLHRMTGAGSDRGASQTHLALILDYASQWHPAGQAPADPEYAFLQAVLERIHAMRPHGPASGRDASMYSPVFWLVDNPGDLPAWLVGGSDGIKQVPVPSPDLATRKNFAANVMAILGEIDPEAVSTFAREAERMTLRAMADVVRLARDAGLGPERIDDAVRAHRVGLLENPWADPAVREQIAHGEAALSGQVKGQSRAVRHALDILVRSATGLTGAETGGSGSGPRGILFFAGPTGVGKTELAKAITALVFGRSDAIIRFDMSEFAAEHNEARLIGSPPGYVGHGEGGHLTNAVRQHPFSVVLFDEIEKAHPLILDKFLQILSDGRLTDGSGDTVHFSETLIVFTSNAGLPAVSSDGPLPHGTDFEKRVRAGLRDFFTDKIGRPELLGRIGENNIVVFDYISPQTGRELAERFIDNVLTTASTRHGAPVTMAAAVREGLLDWCTADLTLGGRGIRMSVEALLVNPLARALFSYPQGTPAIINALEREAEGWHTITLR